jgi:hypothetical protein
MSMERQEVDELLRQSNPVPVASLTYDDQARSTLERILASPPEDARSDDPSRRRLKGARLLLGTAATIMVILSAVAAGLVLIIDRSPAIAATPPLLAYRPLPGSADASTLLTGIADRVSTLPDDSGSGTVAHLRLADWSLWTTVDGERVTSEVVPQETEFWIAADGSGRERRSYQRPGDDEVVSEESYGPGGRSTMWPLGSLSSDPKALEQQLTQFHPVSKGPAERLVAVTDASRSMPLPPPVRAAMLRYLAGTPGLTIAGYVTDRAGRPGIGFHLDSAYSGLPTRYTVIIDEATGRVLANEDMLTTTAGMLNVPVPSVISYTVYLSATYE